MAVTKNEQLIQQVEQLQKTLEDLRGQVTTLMQSRPHESVIMLIDRSNLDQTWRRVDNNSGMKPDYIKIRDVLTDNRSLRQARVYYSDVDECMVREDERSAWRGRQDFYTFLRHQGFMLRGVKKKIYEGVHVEKGLDGALIRDMEQICRDGRANTVILVAGDADYADVVGDVQDRYCSRVEVAFFPNQTARELQVRASKFINLECIRDKIVRRPENQY